MEDLDLQERPGLFTKLKTRFVREEPLEEVGYETHQSMPRLRVHNSQSRYEVRVRRQILSFQDAVAAAEGLKRGEQQVLNLNIVDPVLREKIKDFMCGVNFAEEGTWEELGDNIYLVAPPHATVQVEPATHRVASIKN